MAEAIPFLKPCRTLRVAFHVSQRQKRRPRAPAPHKQLLAAAAGAAAAHASVAAAVAGHDAAAEAAGGGVAQVDQAGEGVGGVDGAGSRLPVADFRSRAAYFSGPFRQGSRGTQSEIVEQQLLLSG